MNVALAFVTTSGTGAAFSELDEVRTRRPLESRSGAQIPVGQTGTVVAVWPEGAAYEVEFGETPDTLLTVDVEDLELERRRA